MIAKRIVACLDVEDGIVVKGRKFKNLTHAGDPVRLAREYYKQGIDELVFLDIGATYQSRKTMLNVVEMVAEVVFVPLTVGGGICSVEDFHEALRHGADKVAVCSAIFNNPSLISGAAQKFGSQCVVVSIDAKRNGNSWTAYKHGGRIDTGLDVLELAEQLEQDGAGEILLNSIDSDGTGDGYDCELTSLVSGRVRIPVIASGGAGKIAHLSEAFGRGRADAALVASMLHFRETDVKSIKNFLKSEGVTVR